MTGSIQTKTNRKNYFAVINVYDEHGKRRLKWIDTGIPTKGNNKRLANKRLQEILVEYANSGIDVTKDEYFTDFMKDWLEVLRNSIAPTTYDSYSIILNNHILPYFERKRLKVKAVSPAVVQAYVSEKLKSGLSSNTVRKHLANISKCLDSAVKQNIIAFKD
ncbi:MAG: phage integrase SAM-like domain-containing protein [Clostridiales bacterium]|jgi:hypothetical protein|nr:phage integrase SAM-like domain-containing protein [Clostridiales bacterium]